MSYSKKTHFAQNLAAIRRALDLQHAITPEDIGVLKKYTGFGALKCVLLPAGKEEDKQHWPKSELELFPLVEELHRILATHETHHILDGGAGTYKRYMDSIKNSVLTAFYTPSEIVQSIATSLSAAGIQAQSILDPSAGATGQFVRDFKSVFPQSNIVAFEKDLISGRILQRLYPDEKIHVAGFETIPEGNNNRFDIVASNIPFGDISVPDTAFHLSKNPTRQFAGRHIHNYFFLKGIDTLREGGILAFITSQGVADAPANKPVREWLMGNTNLVSAIRLPNNLFLENAGTEVGSDLIILQKKSHKTQLSDSEKLFIETGRTKAGIGINKYIYNRANLIFTDTKIGTDPYGKPAVVLTHNGGVTGIAENLRKSLTRDISEKLDISLYRKYASVNVNQPQPKQQAPSSEPILTLYDLFGFSTPPMQQQATLPKLPEQVAADSIPQLQKYTGKTAGHHKPGALVKNDRLEVGVLSVDEDNNFIFNPLQVQDKDKVLQYIGIRDTYYDLYSSEQTSQTENQEKRERLNQLYDEFIARYGVLNSKGNRTLIDMDANRVEMLAVEHLENERYVKSDIFHKPVAFAQHIEIATPEEALLASLDRYGEVRLDFIGKEVNISEEEAFRQLENKIFYNPFCNTNHEIAAKFLSGNIVEKIELLSNFAQRNGENEQLAKSITALQNVVPEKIPFELLEFNFGERWLPAKVYNEFATHLFQTKTEVRYYAVSDEFVVKAHNYTAEIHNKYNIRTKAR
ncbi:MAG: N-6 DNA methylase, partial [Bacteroidales bacterium]|nr:N-6 DNA methylase [Bacteroidales bacterium]